jgi:hypothetical protein
MGNFSLQRSPWKFWELQTSPSDSRLPSSSSGTAASPSVPLCHRRSPLAQAPELHLQLQHTSTRRFPSIPTPFLSPGGFSHARHDIPELPPAATSSPPWNAHHRALTFSLSCATAPLQHTRPSLLLPELHARGQPTPDLLRLNQHLHKLSRGSLVLLDHSWPSNFH